MLHLLAPALDLLHQLSELHLQLMQALNFFSLLALEQTDKVSDILGGTAVSDVLLHGVTHSLMFCSFGICSVPSALTAAVQGLFYVRTLHELHEGNGNRKLQRIHI